MQGRINTLLSCCYILDPNVTAIFSIRNHSHMTSALRGGGLAQKQKIVLIGCVSGTVTRGKEVQKSQTFTDVIQSRAP